MAAQTDAAVTTIGGHLRGRLKPHRNAKGFVQHQYPTPRAVTEMSLFDARGRGEAQITDAQTLKTLPSFLSSLTLLFQVEQVSAE